MIFVTVGSQMPFDRLVVAMDQWASERAGCDVFAQVGKDGYRPNAMRFADSISPRDFLATVASSALIVAHAGMGSVLTALEFGKPIVLLPRQGALQETRNDHQIATARWLMDRPGVFVAMNESELPTAIDRAMEMPLSGQQIPKHATPSLISALQEFICN